jgi:hypothetical protein
MGRFVKRGERGIQILAPVTGFRRRKDGLQEETESKPQRIVIGFRAVYVFERLSRDLRPRFYAPG